jgi:glyoxylase-like metal-dependent hydrolase (beta-lactamase superfamily II)
MVDSKTLPVKSAPEQKLRCTVLIAYPLNSGQLDTIAPGVQRLVANNPGFMTGPGTNTYLVGNARFAVIDPGPADPKHIDRLLAVTRGAIDLVLVTHTHGDHSPAAPILAKQCNAQLLGRPAPGDGRQDLSFAPTRVLADNEEIDIDGMKLRALHTPGHASNHVCYLLEDARLLFTGDHLMQGSTVVIAPPDGDMLAYLRSLERLQREPVGRLAPGHGLTIEDAQSEITRIVAHRLQREAKVAERLRQFGPGTLDDLVTRVYDDVDPRLHALAKSSLWAHLLKLEHDGRARVESQRWSSLDR